MADPIPLRARATRPARTQPANGSPTGGVGPSRGLGSARPPAYHRMPVSPLRWHARWPRPHPLAWALFGCVAFWWAVICAVRF
jgi:hypothetical protein